ncbi:hypothetical protein BKI52_26890 [marine bacterium AO1-C]|nr:hypothetical protein BKI52_26890 [marine bacterium AO1-C]
MKTYITFFIKKIPKYITLCLGLCISTSSFAQSDDVVKIINTSQSDFNKLMDAYFTPFSKAFGTSLNNGWYNTAEPLRRWKFDIRILASASLTPLKDQTIDLNSLGLSDRIVLDPNNTTTAGIFSSNKGVPIQYFPEGVNASSGSTASLNLPDGAGAAILPLPLIQLNMGLPKGTELSIRFLPAIPIETNEGTIESDDNRFRAGMWGVGIKHDFQQWIPGFNLWPIKFAVAMGYTRTKINLNSTLTPTNANLVIEGTSTTPDLSVYNDQDLELKANSFYFGLLFSRKFPLLTFYGGARVESSNSSFAIKGTYPVTVEDTDTNSSTFGQQVVREITDPFNINRSFGQVSFNLGMRLKLGIFSLFVDYSQGTQQYQNITAGFGFGIFDN